MTVTVRSFQDRLTSLTKKTNINRFVVAFSGGLDSHVLLYLCATLKHPVQAIYINHGLQKEASDWAKHCKVICKSLKVPIKILTVDALAKQGESPEAAARTARYNALHSFMKKNDCLLTAHHREDQAETLLLQLFRGAGVHGLSSMPGITKQNKVWHARPLMIYSKIEIYDYAIGKNLNWIEDPSNKDTSFDRNFVRSKIMPLLNNRWENISKTISHAANLQQSAAELIEDLAKIDLANVITGVPHILSLTKLHLLSHTRQYNVVRYWLKQVTGNSPSKNVLQEVIQSVITSSQDAEPLVRWGETEIRRFKDSLYNIDVLPELDPTYRCKWPKDNKTITLKELKMKLSLKKVKGTGIHQKYLKKGLTIGFRVGGEKIKIKGRKDNRSVKKLLQEADIPTWERNRIPLLFVDNELACVCGNWIAEKYTVEADETGWVPVVQPV